ncbi:HAD family hydrolase [Lentisphaerota bacterium ZTH]|nr:HAD family hydrolase [Lentisphaerota bacterium]WET07147.1 HAD family hydrolase [Lentisphaerota bacterium ZTH]
MNFDGLIFDMDGTLTIPVIEFQKIRDELKIPPGADIAEEIDSWPEPRRTAGWELIEEHEMEASRRNLLQAGVEDALTKFKKSGIKLGIITRNTRRSADILVERLPVSFDIILTREFEHIKPAPEPVLHILEKWQIPGSRCLMIGDYIHDIQSAKAAGALACFYRNPDGADWSESADFTVESYLELEAVVLDG